MYPLKDNKVFEKGAGLLDLQAWRLPRCRQAKFCATQLNLNDSVIPLLPLLWMGSWT